MTELQQRIIRKSADIDQRFAVLPVNRLERVKVLFRVPCFHPRYREVRRYRMEQRPLDARSVALWEDKTYIRIFLVAQCVSKHPYVEALIRRSADRLVVLSSTEGIVKTTLFLERLVAALDLGARGRSVLTAIGGGLVLNVGSYVAEQCKSQLVLVPSTVLSMADGSGGKVRANAFVDGRAHKHYYKSFYEPDLMILDRRLLASLPTSQIRMGLVEIAKHGLFQSAALYDYLVKNGGRLLWHRESLLKAILWTAHLKRVCLEVDVEENEYGSRGILRAGHQVSDRLEEESEFTIPHGYAVAIGILTELRAAQDERNLARALEVFSILGIPTTLEALEATHGKETIALVAR